MTVTIKQRKPDEVTGEQHTYHRYGVVMICTARDGLGGLWIKIVDDQGRQMSYALDVFDFEVR